MEPTCGPATVVVIPPHEIDLATAHASAQEIADAFAAGARHVVVDFAAVDFCDSTGLRVIINAAKRARAADATLTVVNPSRALRRLADVVGATELLRLSEPPP